ncbi:unnamed protein product [Fusarium graminearum]|nr:unnamed protein product [Fusarium graminearum]
MMLVQDELGDFCVHMVGHSEFWSLDPEVEVSGGPYLIISHPTLCLVEPYFTDGKGDINIHLISRWLGNKAENLQPLQLPVSLLPLFF